MSRCSWRNHETITSSFTLYRILSFISLIMTQRKNVRTGTQDRTYETTDATCLIEKERDFDRQDFTSFSLYSSYPVNPELSIIAVCFRPRLRTSTNRMILYHTSFGMKYQHDAERRWNLWIITSFLLTSHVSLESWTDHKKCRLNGNETMKL